MKIIVNYALALICVCSAMSLCVAGKNPEDINAKDERGWTDLMWVAHDGYQDKVKLLLDKGADVNIEGDDSGTTALIEAAGGGYIDIVKLLLDKGANINAKTFGGETALTRSSAKGHIDTVKLLLDKNAKENIDRALIEAAGNGYIDIVKLLIDRGADVNAKNFNGETALMEAEYCQTEFKFVLDSIASVGVQRRYGALYHGAKNIVKLLLDKGADVNAKDNNGKTALMAASSIGDNDINNVKLLLDKGADVNAKDNYGQTALMAAVQMENGHDIVRLLLDRGADVNVKDDYGTTTPLMTALFFNNTDIVRLLLDRGADVNAKDKNGKTPLITAARAEGAIDIVPLLLDRGADVNAKDNYGKIALDYVLIMQKTSLDYAKNNPELLRPELLRLLEMLKPLQEASEKKAVPAKTEPSEKDFSHVAQNEDWGNYYLDHGTPLMRAACAGNVAEVQKLLKTSNEAINAKDKYKHTPLMMAAYFGKADVIKELLNAGADVNIQGGGFDETALMLAVYRGNLAIVKELLKAKGINLDLQNMRMKTALDIAKDTGNKDIVTALESAFKKLTFRKMITDQQLRHNNSSFNELKTRLEEQRKTIGIDKKRRVLLIQQALATRQ